MFLPHACLAEVYKLQIKEQLIEKFEVWLLVLAPLYYRDGKRELRVRMYCTVNFVFIHSFGCQKVLLNILSKKLYAVEFTSYYWSSIIFDGTSFRLKKSFFLAPYEFHNIIWHLCSKYWSIFKSQWVFKVANLAHLKDNS